MKKVWMFILVLLVLFAAAPVMAVPKTTTMFTAEVHLIAGSVSQGEQRITENGILHVINGISEGTVNSISGPDISGSLWTSLDGSGKLETGKGSFRGKWALTTSEGVFEGFVVGGIVANYISGTLSGFRTVDRKAERLKGSFEGYIILESLEVELTLQGVLVSKG